MGPIYSPQSSAFVSILDSYYWLYWRSLIDLPLKESSHFPIYYPLFFQTEVTLLKMLMTTLSSSYYLPINLKSFPVINLYILSLTPLYSMFYFY